MKNERSVFRSVTERVGEFFLNFRASRVLMPGKPLHLDEKFVEIALPDRFHMVRIFVGAEFVPDKRIDRTVCRHPA
mgnify:CR=1 FL=1